MVEVKVVRAFCDKDTQEFVKPGDVIKKSQTRADELSAGGFVKAVDAKAEPEKEAVADKKPETMTTKNIAKPSTKEEKKFE